MAASVGLVQPENASEGGGLATADYLGEVLTLHL